MWNQSEDVGATHLSNALMINSRLKTLDLYGNQIGDSGATRLSEMLPSPYVHLAVVEGLIPTKGRTPSEVACDAGGCTSPAGIRGEPVTPDSTPDPCQRSAADLARPPATMGDSLRVSLLQTPDAVHSNVCPTHIPLYSSLIYPNPPPSLRPGSKILEKPTDNRFKDIP